MVPGVRGLASSNISGNYEPPSYWEGPILILTEGPERGKRWELKQETITIGRHASCDIVLLDRRVSRFHARITRQGKNFVLEDLGSKNGTFVNGISVSAPVPLKDGDEIAIAFAFKFLFVDTEATAPVAPESEPLLKLDKASRKVWVKGKELIPPLSPLQFRLLELLYDASGHIVTREEIAQALWPEAKGGVTDQAIDALIHRLRERLASLEPNVNFVETVRGHGFRLLIP